MTIIFMASLILFNIILPSKSLHYNSDLLLGSEKRHTLGNDNA